LSLLQTGDASVGIADEGFKPGGPGVHLGVQPSGGLVELDQELFQIALNSVLFLEPGDLLSGVLAGTAARLAQLPARTAQSQGNSHQEKGQQDKLRRVDPKIGHGDTAGAAGSAVLVLGGGPQAGGCLPGLLKDRA
jgi:hypothetical protein